MEDYLLKSQKNLIFKKIEETDLNPAAFNWEWYQYDEVAEPWLRLSFAGTNFFFEFHDHKYPNHFAWFSPGEEKVVDEYGAELNWGEQFALFCKWLKYLKREVTITDLWAGLAKYQVEETDAGTDSPAYNTEFSADDLDLLLPALRQAREYMIQKWGVSESDKQQINKRVEYLLEAATRQGRKDWFHICVGAMVTLCTSLAVQPQQASEIWRIIKTALVETIIDS